MKEPRELFEQKTAKDAKNQNLFPFVALFVPFCSKLRAQGSAVLSKATGFEQKTAKVAKNQDMKTGSASVSSRSLRPSVKI